MSRVGYKSFSQELFPKTQIERMEVGGNRIYSTPKGDFASVTSILSILSDGGLEKWKKRVGSEEAEKIVKNASEKGSVLHEYCERYLLNTLDRNDISGEGAILFSQVKNRLDKIDCVYGTEIPLYNESLGYAGTADALVRIGNHNTVVDFKNARTKFNLEKAYSRRKLFKYLLQCTAYAMAAKRQYGIEFTRARVIVANVADMTSNVYDIDIDNYYKRELKLIVSAFVNKDFELVQRSSYFSL